MLYNIHNSPSSVSIAASHVLMQLLGILHPDPCVGAQI